MWLNALDGTYNIRCRKDGTSCVNLNYMTFTKTGGITLNYATTCSSTLNINGSTTITAGDNSLINFGPDGLSTYLNIGSTKNLSSTLYIQIQQGFGIQAVAKYKSFKWLKLLIYELL
jgi:hypothetical protein